MRRKAHGRRYCKVYPVILFICYLEGNLKLASIKSPPSLDHYIAELPLLQAARKEEYCSKHWLDKLGPSALAEASGLLIDLHIPAVTGVPAPSIHWIPGIRLFKRDRKRTLIAATSSAISSSQLASSSLSTQSLTATAPSVSTSKVPLKPATDVIAGAFARACSQTTIHPLDTFKVRLQARVGNVASSGAASLAGPPKFDLLTMGKNVGSLYRGVFGAASGAGIAIGAYFAFYGVACNTISRNTDLSPSAVAFSAGGIAAAGSSLVKVPLAVCIRSVQAGIYPNAFNAANSIVTAAGPRGLFTGYLPTLLEDVPDMAIKFAGYESLRMLHSQVTGGRAASLQEDFAMGAFAGAVSAAVTTPLDVIKTNMMVMAASRPTLASASSMIMAEGGPKAFFRGIGPRAASNGINSAVFFCFFEAFRGAIKERNAKQAQMVISPITIDSGSE
eukprot:gene18391-24862_t